MTSADLIVFAIPVFVVTMVIELLWIHRGPGGALRGYEPKDTAASLAMGVGNLLFSLPPKVLVFTIFLWLYEHRLFEIGKGPLAWVALFFLEDLCYYGFHRAHHEVRFLWAAHVNHHSSQRYNLSTALRQSWTTPITGPIFWVPLPLLGFHPAMILVAQTVSLLYQYWIHTEAMGRLGPLELVLNTPSHHRVHHGSDDLYLDRNHGGILIVWDRLFGTFQQERETPRYGIRTNIESFHPLVIAFHEWAAMFRDAARAAGWRAKLGTLFMPPGWAPGGGVTSKTLRDRAKQELARA
ncbi:MAG: sterol desaturase family protein [Myxococcota bacterium]